MRVLVTGGAGLIGSAIADELLSAGYQVTIVDSLDPDVHPKGRPGWISPEARFIQADVRDVEALVKALEGCEGAFHQAASGGFNDRYSHMSDVNCTGSACLIEAIARAGGVAKLVIASSMAVYGEGYYRCAEHGVFHAEPRQPADLAARRWEQPCPSCREPAAAQAISERMAVRPHGLYACSKYFQERMLLSQAGALGIDAVALRYFLTFGPRQSVYNPYSGICSIFATRILSGLPPVVYEDGLQTRDIVYVGDVARANRVVFEDQRASGRTFNVGSGLSTSIAGFARLLAEALGRPIEPSCPGRFRPMDNRHMLADVSSLGELGWAPQLSVRQGLERYVDWIASLGPVEEYFSRAEALLKRSGIVREVSA